MTIHSIHKQSMENTVNDTWWAIPSMRMTLPAGVSWIQHQNPASPNPATAAAKQTVQFQIFDDKTTKGCNLNKFHRIKKNTSRTNAWYLIEVRKRGCPNQPCGTHLHNLPYQSTSWHKICPCQQNHQMFYWTQRIRKFYTRIIDKERSLPESQLSAVRPQWSWSK